MCNSKSEETSDGTKQSNTNVGLLNLSENSTAVGMSEILEIIILLILIWFVKKQRQNERRERKLEEVIQRVEAGDSKGRGKTSSSGNTSSTGTSTKSTIGCVNPSGHV